MKTFLIASALALTVSAPALAQGFDGPRIELRGGYDHGNVSVTYSDEDGETRESGGMDGISYGGEIGYDLDTGGTIIGAYAGLDFADTQVCDEVFGQDQACVGMGRNFTFGVRVGMPVGTWGMLYAKGGYSNGRVKASYEDFENILPNENAANNLDGFHVGGGIEANLASRVYGKVEYVYTDYGSLSAGTPGSDSTDLSRHQVLAGAGLRF